MSTHGSCASCVIPSIAEELTVETLWRIYRARHRFRPDGNFAAWARRIATNLALDYLRRKRPEQSLSQTSPDRLSPIISCSGKREKRSIRHFAVCRSSCR